jgi:hypothetical protein
MTKPIGSGELMRHVDLSYRQIDYWCSQGAIVPSGSPCNPGYGHRRQWSIRDVQRLQAIARFQRLAKAFARDVPTDVLHEIWCGLADNDTVTIGGNGATLTIELAPVEWAGQIAS